MDNNSVVKLDCLENTNAEFITNLTQLKENFNFSHIIELNIKHKLINNIADSNVKSLFKQSLRRLSINKCNLKSIKKGMFNLMLQLKKLSLSQNEILLIESDSFSTGSYETHLLELFLSENKLNKIQSKTFQGLLKLQVLLVDTNQIDEIEVNSFENLNDLRHLNFQSNMLRNIKYGSFNGLLKLQTLYLDKNEIEDIEENSFRDLNDLRELFIQKNKIKFVKNEIFFDKKELEILHLYQNNIESIETIPFNTLRSLKKLHLFSNKIKQIKFGNFIHLQNLFELRLDKNEIGSFEANTFIGLEMLSYLDLSANIIKKIGDKSLHGLINVQRIDLNLNNVNQIEMNAFADLANLIDLNLDTNEISSLKNIQFNSKLKKLSIKFNRLTNLNEINSTSLEYLHVSNNRIQEINLISLMPNLEYLDLSQNRLISLRKNSFFNLTKLKYLNLSYNKLDLQSEFNKISYFKELSLLETLDLSFNDIKYLDTIVTFDFLYSLLYLNLSNNKLKSLNENSLGHLNDLIELNLASNSLILFDKEYFFNLRSLKTLILSSNQLSSISFLKTNKKSLENLEHLDLERNKIVYIDENEFEFFAKLRNLNLNSNQINKIREKTFEKLVNLQSLKISKTKIKSVFLNTRIKELDLSYLNISITNKKQINQIEWINLANSKLNCSFGLYLGNQTKYVDFSYNQFKWEKDSKIFNILGSSLEVLKLRQTNLQKIDQINLKNLINLNYLDLSFNNLSFMSQDAFEFNLNLEYLDLSSNCLYEFSIVLIKLKYLNLDNNQINSTNQVLKDYYSIEIFKMANNRLEMYPSFEMSQIKSENVETFLEFHLNQNQINEIKYFSFIFGKLLLANFDSNQISSIETDAFLNCRSLESLSIAQNRLRNLTENNFHFLFSLIHLNVSFNEINFIELKTFMNLNKLKSLDLNYNKLISIENDLFFGLINLNDLYLMSHNEMTFYNQSFHHLPNISSIVLNESLISNYKCLFMHNLQRDIQRTISNKYIFYKSINLITLGFKFNGSLNLKCDLVFHLFQFKIHFNLKTDYDNDLFYDSCYKVLIKRENNFNQTKRNCFSNFVFNDKEEKESGENSVNPNLAVVSNFYFLLSLGFILTLLVPFFYTIFKYELFSKSKSYLTNDSLNNFETLLKEIDIKIKINRGRVKKLLINVSELNEALNARSFSIQLIEKIEKELLVLEETRNNLLSKSKKPNREITSKNISDSDDINKKSNYNIINHGEIFAEKTNKFGLFEKE
jgi:insulin-like growth factor-binding protein complex acid labile subunit